MAFETKIEEVRLKFDVYNEWYFDRKLKFPVIDLSSLDADDVELGFCVPFEPREWISKYILTDIHFPEYVIGLQKHFPTFLDMHNILVHEMIHLDQLQQGLPCGHDDYFQKKAKIHLDKQRTSWDTNYIHFAHLHFDKYLL